MTDTELSDGIGQAAAESLHRHKQRLLEADVCVGEDADGVYIALRKGTFADAHKLLLLAMAQLEAELGPELE